MEEDMAQRARRRNAAGLTLMTLFVLAALAIIWPGSLVAGSKVKLRGYVTGRAVDGALLILDDRLEITPASRVLGQDAAGEHPMKAEEISAGMLIDAEGQWLDKHKFFAEKITIDLRESEKKIHGKAYLQEEPEDASKIAAGEAGELKLDGYWLEVSPSAKREWDVEKAAGAKTAAANGKLAACHVNYVGIRRKDGKVEAEQLELGPPAGADAYKMPHDLEVVRARDPQTGIDILEFRQGKKVHGRLKLLAERSVQEYVSHLGDSLLPAGAEGTSRPIEFRFFVIEGNLGIFMAEVGIASSVNGHQRELENQADRLGLQNIIEHGYDPREAANFSRIIIDRYGDRSTSKLWSNHDSSLIRGSFLTIQLMREYPDNSWGETKKNTKAFQTMKEDLGPVKIM